MTLPAITVRPPWSQIIAETAALTALGIAGKTVENRSRAIPARHVGSDIAIHAGKTWCPIGEADIRVRMAWTTFAKAIDYHRPHPLLAAHNDTRTGYVGSLRHEHAGGLWMSSAAVVAVATLADCHRARPERDSRSGVCCRPWGEAEHSGRAAWHLVLDNVRRLPKPVPAKGALQVPWTLPAEVEAQVRAQLAERVGV